MRLLHYLIYITIIVLFVGCGSGSPFYRPDPKLIGFQHRIKPLEDGWNRVILDLTVNSDVNYVEIRIYEKFEGQFYQLGHFKKDVSEMDAKETKSIYGLGFEVEGTGTLELRIYACLSYRMQLYHYYTYSIVL